MPALIARIEPRRVPVIARGDQHGVDVGPGQQLEHVAVGGAIVVAVLGVGHGLDRLPPAGPDVADGHELHVRLGDHALQVVPAAGADADGAQHDPLAGRHDAVAAQRPGRQIAGSATPATAAARPRNSRRAIRLRIEFSLMISPKPL